MDTQHTTQLGRVLAPHERKDEPRLIQKDAAAYLGCSPDWLQILANRGRGPRSERVGRFRYYRLCDLDAYKANKASTAAPVDQTLAAVIVSHVNDEARFNQAQAAEYLERSPRWMQMRHREGGGPASVKVGRTRYYRRSALDAYRVEMEASR